MSTQLGGERRLTLETVLAAAGPLGEARFTLDHTGRGLVSPGADGWRLRLPKGDALSALQTTLETPQGPCGLTFTFAPGAGPSGWLLEWDEAPGPLPRPVLLMLAVVLQRWSAQRKVPLHPLA